MIDEVTNESQVGSGSSDRQKSSDHLLVGRLREALAIASAGWDDHIATEKIQTAVIAELHHRIKNSLGVVTAIVSQSLSNASTLDEASSAIMGRLHALGIAHDLLLKNEWIKTNGRLIIEEAVAAFRGNGASSQYVLSGVDFTIGSTSAVSLSMIINELSTNATKYGSLSVPGGKVTIGWTLTDRFHLVWKEIEGPKVDQPKRKSFGSRMIESALPGQMNAQARLEYERDGVRCTIDVPMTSMLQ